MTALLRLENVSMSYPMQGKGRAAEHIVCDKISLELVAGERLGIVGRNGSGKSTLLRLMAKIFAPTSGRVRWAPGSTVSLLSLGLGFRPDLTGRENALLSSVAGVEADARNNLSGIEDFAELGDFFNQPVRTYSTGMRARLGFASALMNGSDAILIDEILSVGDQQFRLKAREALKNQLTEDRGVVVVSHAEEQIKELCSCVTWLSDKKITNPYSVEKVFQDFKKAD